MDAVKSFNDELSGIYEAKPPISRAKMTLLTKKAIKGIKFYKHIVQSMEKFVQKCKPEYKVPGLYVLDSVVRQSRHQFGAEKDVFMPRLCKNIISTFQHIYKCPQEDKPRVLRVLNLWQKNAVFPPEIVQQLTVMGGAPTLEAPRPGASASAFPQEDTSQQKPAAPDQANLTNILANLISNPDASQVQNLAGLLSSSQQNQLEDLLKQVKGADQLSFDSDDLENLLQPNHKEPSPPPPQANIMAQRNVYQPPPRNEQPPFMQTQRPDAEQRKPAFNREVLDFDYSDDEHTPPAKIPKQSHSIDPNLLAKLPTADQIQQLTGSNHSGGQRFDREEQRQRLEQEQEIFNKQIQEMESRSKSTSQTRSDREGSFRRKRSRSRSRSRDRHRHHRKRSHSRDRHRSRRSRSRERSRRSRRSRSKSREGRREKKGFPPVKEGFISVCSTTLWIGNIAAKVMQHELQGLVEEYGKVESINMIPPRGCAYVCMKERLEADKALHKIKHCRLSGKSLKCDWAPGKEMPEKQKVTWVKELGVNYVELTSDPTLIRSLTAWGCVDPQSVPEHRRDEINPPEPEPVIEEPEKIVPQASQPQMIPSFSPATVPSVPTMVPQPQMPVMVRPFQLNPFGMPPRMRLPQTPVSVVREPVPPAPVPDTSADMTVDSPESRTPTADEQPEPPLPQMQPTPTVAQFQPQFGAVSVAQRFSGAMPVQLQMMPNMNQQLMQSRMGVMPIRMGVMPMQLRPGFHPGMQRLPMQGRPPMMAGHPMRPPMHQAMPPHSVAGFHPGMRMGMHGRPPVVRPQMPEGIPISRPMAPQERRPSTPSSEKEDPPQPREFAASPPPEMRRRGFHDGPPSSMGPRGPYNRPPHEFQRPPFGASRFERPPMTRPERPPMARPERPPMARPERPPMTRPPLDMNRSPPRDLERSQSRDIDGPPRDMDRGPPRDMDRGPPRDMDRGPPRDMDRGPPRDMDRGPPRDMDRGPPRDIDRGPSRDMDRAPPRESRGPPRDDRSPPRDMDRSSRDRRDHDRGRRDRSRERDRRDRDGDRDRRGRDRDADRDRRAPRDREERGRRDFDRGGRDFDRRDRGPPRGGRSFRGRDDRGRGRGRGFGGRGRGGGRGGFGRGGGFGGGGDRESPEIDPEELEYQRKREETLRKRHEEEDEYVVEEIDFTAFGLPSGFGGVICGKDTKTEEDSGKKDRSPSRRDRDRSPRRERRSRRDSEERSRRGRDRSSERKDRSNRDRSPKKEDHPPEEPVSTKDAASEPAADRAERTEQSEEQSQKLEERMEQSEEPSQKLDQPEEQSHNEEPPEATEKPNINDVEMEVEETEQTPVVEAKYNGDTAFDDAPVHDDVVKKPLEDVIGQTYKSPGTPTFDEQGHEVVEEFFEPEAEAPPEAETAE